MIKLQSVEEEEEVLILREEGDEGDEDDAAEQSLDASAVVASGIVSIVLRSS